MIRGTWWIIFCILAYVTILYNQMGVFFQFFYVVIDHSHKELAKVN